MSDISTFILHAVTTHGLLVASGVLFLGSLGLPVPCTITVIMLGAFVREQILSGPIVAIAALLSSVSGDLVIFGIGRLGRSWIPQRIQHSAPWVKIESSFLRHAGIAVFMTRWFMTSLAFPASLIAGKSKYSFSKFLSIDLLGEAVWIALFGGLGYAFSSQLDLIGDLFSSFTGFLLGLLIVSVGVYAVLRFSGLKLRGKRRRQA